MWVNGAGFSLGMWALGHGGREGDHLTYAAFLWSASKVQTVFFSGQNEQKARKTNWHNENFLKTEVHVSNLQKNLKFASQTCKISFEIFLSAILLQAACLILKRILAYQRSTIYCKCYFKTLISQAVGIRFFQRQMFLMHIA